MARVPSPSIAAALPAAATAFAKRSIDGTRMEDIAAATGIPRATLYYHFASKEEILTWLLERLLQRLAEDIGTILDRPDPAQARVEDVVEAYLRLFADHPDLYGVLFANLGRVTRIPALADSVWAGFHQPVAKLLGDGERDGTLRSVSRETTSSAVFGAITMVGLHHVVTCNPADVERVSHELNDLLTRGTGDHADERTARSCAADRLFLAKLGSGRASPPAAIARPLFRSARVRRPTAESKRRGATPRGSRCPTNMTREDQ